MDFASALTALRLSQKARRGVWPEGACIWIDSSGLSFNVAGPLTWVSGRGAFMPDEDILASDWEIA